MKRLSPASLRFVSWNILGDANAANNPHLYRQCDPRALANRQPQIIDGILRLNPDIVGLQEVENWDLDYLPALHAAGLQGVFKQRTGDAQVDGVALVWRTKRLTLLHIEALSYAQLLTEGVKDRALFETFNKGNVGLLGLFRDNLNGRELVVATTHLLWNPNRGLVKLKQAQCILNRSAALSAAGAQAEPLPLPLVAAASVSGSSKADTKKVSLVAAPTPKAGAAGTSMSGIASLRACVLLGDFNCCPGSPLYHFLLGGRLRAPLRTEGTWDGQKASHSHSHKGGNPHARLLPPPLPPPAAMTTIRKTAWPLRPTVTTGTTVTTGKPSQSGGGDGGGGHGGGDRGGRSLSSDGAMDDQVDESHALLPLVSAYGRTSGEPECTSFHGGFQGTVDYILFTESQFSVISKLPTPSRGELRRRRSLPDMAMPSDHVPIAADLEWQVEF